MLAVVSHDAGGAEVLSSYVRQQGLNPFFVLEGPARAIFERKLGVRETLPLEDAVRNCDSILCGTSWQSVLELNAIRSAKLLGKRSVAFLDHWTNYRERFVRSNEIYLPNEIWVGDSVAKSMVAAEFPHLPVRLVENPYFLDIQRELEALPAPRLRHRESISVLYVSEPVREHGRLQFADERHWGYVEEEALRYFLANISALGKPVERILIRPHPSESSDKYTWAQQEFGLPIVQGGSRTLLEEIVDSDVVVGCESMALVVGLLAGKRVISCIPPGGKSCTLPHREIVLLETLVGSGGTRNLVQ